METTQLVLSQFPGLDLLGMAFQREGFCVVRGPDVILGQDIRQFHTPPGRFDGIIGGPPCQMFSRLVHMVRQNGYEPRYGNLIPEFARSVAEGKPRWFVMENVPAAPLPDVPDAYSLHSFLLNNRQCLEDDGQPAAQNRVRRITFGWRGTPRKLMLEIAALESMKFEYAASGTAREMPVAIGGTGRIKRGKTRDGKRLSPGWGPRRSFSDLAKSQGLPAEFDLPGFTVAAKCQAVGNGVPLAMGRALARAVKRVLEEEAAR